ncbi:MAG: ATP-dependent helicase HrpB, partial [Rhodanobacteraceae bacterium]
MIDRAEFPIAALLPELKRALASGTRLVLDAPPGAGKTTQVPPALLGEDWLGSRKILMLEPRRIATRAAAEFMAAQRGESVGETIGYRIRFENKISAATRIEVVTEGILTRMIQDDPELPGVGAILFDEFHERHLHGDLGAALALDVQANLRPDLRLVIMSATLHGSRIERWFDAARIASEGRAFPVGIAHPPARTNENALPHLRRAVEQALGENDGDVLVFLPGKREIDSARTALGAAFPSGAIEIVPLHGELALAEQHAALSKAKSGTRRIVLATNVAESSLTLPGVRAVVDSGLAREPRFDPNSGFTRLETVNISQASADQRAGRAGRLGPGTCYRLWPESRRLDAERSPEIAQVELAQLALELAAWGSADLRWLDAPPPGPLAQARDLLDALGALDRDGRITTLGKEMLGAGMHPRLAANVLRADPARRALAC